ncbi:SH3 domain-containing kinase-binding protein 1-like [Leptopilina heterotoma]|uniref:SH3 domain-containing kinase-binding protein 1-like n=1 Tax=Leptopilina heterotoma TaxID=63436 RepID=UPI001CA9A0BF|nr:SH3 domain-containing kinase-binding protein 1-like [Leptopilina heterotoma]XP_043479603.1 SH3 domain-containing kinase-binding protein 1-like [Leptopilina heterotoma]
MEAIVEYNYVAQEPDELTLKKGDVIKDIKMLHGGWWQGTLKDKRGMFPDNFVKVLETTAGSASGTLAGNRTNIGTGEGSSSSKSDEVTLRNGGSGRRICRVLFSYEPCNGDELKLVPNENVEFLGEVEEGWWRGRLNRRVGVFPSNFVSPPSHEETTKNKDKEVEELCRVLFPYETTNEDELTLAEGDIIKVLSKDAPDKGWWQGQLRGRIGLFPDNFVEVLNSKSEQEHDQCEEVNQVAPKIKHSIKAIEKAYTRKSLDTKSVKTDTVGKKVASPPSPLGSGSSDKKSILSSLKRLVGDNGSSSSNNNSNNNGNGSVSMGLEEELDGVERGEGLPLSHLTASRAKAPRRRPPTTQHLRHTAASSATSLTSPGHAASTEDNMTNGNTENSTEPLREDDGDGPIGKRKPPWVDELKQNQLERKKHGIDRVDKSEVKKERVVTSFQRLRTTTNVAEVGIKPEPGTEEKSKEIEKATPTDASNHVSPNTAQPAFVPYHVFSQLLDRVVALERTVNQLLMANSSKNDE